MAPEIDSLEHVPFGHEPSAHRARRPAPGPVLRLALLGLTVTVALMLGASVASAKDSSARKLGRGFANLTLGVAAIPGEIMETTKEKGPALGATWGFAKGVGMMVATEVVGVWEVLTCPFEFPPGFKPILSPEYPWQYFTGTDPSRTRIAETPSKRTVR